MGLFVVIALLPSPFRKVETNIISTPVHAQTVSKAVEAPKAETPPVVQVEPEAPVVATPAPVQEPPKQEPVLPSYPTDHVEIMQQAGIAASDYSAVDYIISHESGWCATKSEGEFGDCKPYHGHSDYNGYGLCQSTPPGKMAISGADWETNPVTQLKWCTMHANERGGWWPSYNYWIVHHNW